MELVVVAGDGLLRAASRVVAALGKTHEAILLSAADYALSAPPGPDVGVLTLGTELVDPITLDDPAWELHGIRWGTTDNRAWIGAMPVEDPQAVLTLLQDESTEQNRVARQERQTRAMTDPRRFNGPMFAARYLDPKLHVPSQTIAAGGFSFNPERMCWERQYTIGIVDFLAHGFDEWADDIPG